MAKIAKKIRAIIAVICAVVIVLSNIVYASDTINLLTTSTDAETKRLLNGSFEESQEWTDSYKQLLASSVPYWNTTAFEGKLELFRKNTGTYIKDSNNKGVLLAPTDGNYAAELNADEESTLYQNIKTIPSSIYEWGLDHGSRNGTDTMALVIGPKQSVEPSKPNKAGRDHFMQMIDWLIEQNLTSVKTTAGLGEQLTIYSKKFAEAGTFVDNAGNDAFSLTPSALYTEKWSIWIIADSRAEAGETENPWGHYGSNAEGSAGAPDGSGNTSVDLSKYYLYTVPAGQTETIFGFVSVGFVDGKAPDESKAKTYGNFLDSINFQLYHPLSGSTTNHGSAVIGGSDGSTSGEGATSGTPIKVNDKLATFITDGETLKIQAIIKAEDKGSCDFVGVYYTKQDEEGNPVPELLKAAGNVINEEDSDNYTDEQKKDKWIISTNEEGDIIYTYHLENITTATNLHFIFIKNPTITYDPNGGKDYVIEDRPHQNEEPNVYSFRPYQVSDATTYIAPYTSHAAEGQNDAWKFMGWQLTGDVVDDLPDTIEQVNAEQLGTLILPAIHTVACDYSFDGATSENAAQYFKIFDGNPSLTGNEVVVDEVPRGIEWEADDIPKLYANTHKGLTMVAQWRWRQAFIPQEKDGDVYKNSDNGGTVEITGISDSDKEKDIYIGNYGDGGFGKAYFAEMSETITAVATAKPGWIFEGWYDEDENLVSINNTYSYTESKEGITTLYARFTDAITQTYIRQIKNNGVWEDITDDTVGTIDRYEYIDKIGSPISATAAEGANYKFIGWYDAENNLITTNTTLSYITVENATYYARFETAYKVYFKAQTKQADGSFKTDNVGGKVSVASGKDVNGATVSSKASANSGAKFLGWYDKDGNKLSAEATYSTTLSPVVNGTTYYARFEISHNPSVENKVYLSFVAESVDTPIPTQFEARDAGAGKYGRSNKLGNTISTGFKYSIENLTNAQWIKITITVPENSYVKVGGNSTFTGDGIIILNDSNDVEINKGSMQKISAETTLTYYWSTSGMEAGQTYGFIIDNLYAPDATATITVNDTTDATQITEANSVFNVDSSDYKRKSIYKDVLIYLLRRIQETVVD